MNGYVWTFATATSACLVRRSREGTMVDTVLGTELSGALGSDVSAGYHHDPGLHQRCWAHRWRDIHDLTVACPTERVLRR